MNGFPRWFRIVSAFVLFLSGMVSAMIATGAAEHLNPDKLWWLVIVYGFAVAVGCTHLLLGETNKDLEERIIKLVKELERERFLHKRLTGYVNELHGRHYSALAHWSAKNRRLREQINRIKEKT